MNAFLYRCPRKGLRVQGFAADDPSDGGKDAIVRVKCHACGSVHFINVETETAKSDQPA